MTDPIRDRAAQAMKVVAAAGHRHGAAYCGGAERPLGGYLGLLATYASAVGTAGLVARRRGFPARLPWGDVALMSLATHKVSRILAKDPVTSPFRAPFTRFEGPAGEGEINEEVRATGAWHAVGELITCPFCLGQWVASGLLFGFIVAPRATRLAATVFTSLAVSDFLHLAYSQASQAVES